MKNCRTFYVFPLNEIGDDETNRDLEHLCLRYAHVECDVFPNGDSEGDENYVSLLFKLPLPKSPVSNVSWSCVVSVVSSEDRLKFPQSAFYETEVYRITKFEGEDYFPPPSIPFKRFLERRVLLDDEEEHLPAGTLTLRCEMEVRYQRNMTGVIVWSFLNQHIIHDTEDPQLKPELNLNSSLFPALCKASPAFQAIMDGVVNECGASETSPDKVLIKDDEMPFSDMLYFFESGNPDHLPDVPALFRLYLIADKYLVASLIEACRHRIGSLLNIANVVSALAVAYRCLDEELKEVCCKYVHSLSTEEKRAFE